MSTSPALPGPFSEHSQVYVRDRDLGRTERASLGADGAAANGDSDIPSISIGGRHVAFYSLATNLGVGPADGREHVYLRDRLANVTEWIGPSFAQHAYWRSLAMNAGGRFVAFYSEASNLVPGDDNGRGDVFLRDRLTGQIERVSVNDAGTSIDFSWYPAVSADGRYVAFCSMAPLVPEDRNGFVDVYLRDRQLGKTERISVDADGADAAQHSCSQPPSINGNGRFVAFDSEAPDLVRGDTNGKRDVFVRDRLEHRTVRASLGSGRRQLLGISDSASLSDSGAVVAFRSWGDDVVRGDSNGRPDAFVHDLRTGVTTLVSIDSQRRLSVGSTEAVSINADDRFVAFSSTYGFGDQNTAGRNVYLHERREAVLYSNLAHPTEPGWFRNATMERVWDDFLPGSPGLLTGLTVAVGNSRPTPQPGAPVDIEFRRRDASGLPRGELLGRVALDWSAKTFKTGTNIVRAENLGRFGVVIPIDDFGVAMGVHIADPNQSLGLLTYDPPTLGGSYDGYWVDDDPTRYLCGPVPCRFGFEVRSEPPFGPTFTLRPDALHFGSQTLGSRKTESFELRNTGVYPVSLSTFALRGSDRARFALTQNCGTVLAIGETCTISVTFAPTATGYKQAEFKLTTFDGQVRKRLLDGTGIRAQFGLAPATLSFGGVPVGGRSAEALVTLSNTSASNLPIRGIALVGENPELFRRRHNCPAELGSGQACQITVWFYPSRIGEVAASLAVWSGGGAGMKSVTLSARGL